MSNVGSVDQLCRLMRSAVSFLSDRTVKGELNPGHAERAFLDLAAAALYAGQKAASAR